MGNGRNKPDGRNCCFNDIAITVYRNSYIRHRRGLFVDDPDWARSCHHSGSLQQEAVHIQFKTGDIYFLIIHTDAPAFYQINMGFNHHAVSLGQVYFDIPAPEKIQFDFGKIKGFFAFLVFPFLWSQVKAAVRESDRVNRYLVEAVIKMVVMDLDVFCM